MEGDMILKECCGQAFGHSFSCRNYHKPEPHVGNDLARLKTENALLKEKVEILEKCAERAKVDIAALGNDNMPDCLNCQVNTTGARLMMKAIDAALADAKKVDEGEGK